MKLDLTSIGIPGLTMLAFVTMATFSTTGMAADDDQAEREARRFDNEIRRQQEQAQRDSIDNRARAQAEALRSQEEAIRRMEATQARMNSDAEQRAQQAAEQSRIYIYPYYPDRTPSASNMPSEPVTQITPITPTSPALPPVASSVPGALDRRPNDQVSRINFAPLSEQLKTYFGTQSGVLVVSAGNDALFGLQDGDVIISVDGRVPADGPHAARILRSYQPGERVKLRVQRNRRVIDLDTAAPGQRGN